MNDLIRRVDAIALASGGCHPANLAEELAKLPSAHPEIIRCKECKNAPKCYGDVVMRSRGGGYIYCPVTFCSNEERKDNE